MVDNLLGIEVEKQLLLQDRPTDRTAELVEAFKRHRRNNKRASEVVDMSVQVVVLKELICRAVKVLSATLCNLVKHYTSDSILGGE